MAKIKRGHNTSDREPDVNAGDVSPDYTDDIELDPLEIELVQQQQNNNNTRNNHKAKKDAINNIPGLHAALQSLLDAQSYDPQTQWNESLSLTSTTCISDILTTYDDIHDDLKRESTFYSIANAGVISGLAKCESLNISYQRPSDYYVEMLKPDQHMNKIKNRLIQEKSRIESVNIRKKSIEQKKYLQAIQSETNKQKSQVKQRAKLLTQQYQQKTNTNNKSDQIKIQRSKLPLIDATLQSAAKSYSKHNATSSSSSSSRLSKSDRSVLPTKGFKRQNKDAKYGNGGKKRYIKDNTSDSSRDMKPFHGKSNSTGFAQLGGRYAKKSQKNKSGGNRPGKTKRQKMR